MTSAVPGTVYEYHSNAEDPNQDRVTYSLLAGPEDLTIYPSSGLIRWQTTPGDLGNHSVVIGAEDPFGAKTTQSFTISVEDTGNRPPRFTSTPVTVAEAGVQYRYDLEAVDPDVDPLEFTLVSGPEGLVIEDSERGLVTWTPPIELIGETVDVSALVEDGRGGSAVHEFSVRVVADATNHPPIIVSEPETQYVLPQGFDNPAQGAVSPDGISLILEDGELLETTVSITLPEDAASSSKVDVFLLFDDTGSYAGQVPTVTSRFPEIIDDLEASFPEVDFGFGVGRYEEYSSFAGEDSGGRPFILNQAIVTTDTPGFQQAIDQALDREAPGFGGDGPETGIEALYQIATGAGFDGNQNGSTLDSGFSLSLIHI